LPVSRLQQEGCKTRFFACELAIAIQAVKNISVRFGHSSILDFIGG
jgi:hypothetical protein